MALELAAATFRRGETLRYRLTVTLEDGGPKEDIAAVEWNLIDQLNVKVLPVNKTLLNGVAFEGAPALGILTVTVDESETQALDVAHQVHLEQEWMITDALGDREIYRGKITLLRSALAPAA